ncbi:hypothetical protein GGR53DRAFT_514667 [Hypoxylon sp. FL1150]|nr:hypothetical protein GGR53DRAFT_514667 [Hypoxylon sp. FL1150]
MNDASRTGYGPGSPTSTESGTLVLTPFTSRANSISQPSSTDISSGPLDLTLLSTTSWRQPYPSIGQFAMTDSEEVVAAGPNGLFYFKRVQDHPATPWSEPRPFPNTQVTLNALTVSGLALYRETVSRLLLYCVSGGVLHSFYLTDENSSFIPNNSPPLASYKVMGMPTVVKNGYSSGDGWSLVVPSQSGGLLHTSKSTQWKAVDHLATDLGIISAFSVTALRNYPKTEETELVAVCISRGQLNVVQGPLRLGSMTSSWLGKTSTRILCPGEVTGNPALISERYYDQKAQIDLLVPSVEGGIFHFVRTQSTPNDWHMIGRIAFPQNIPPASCLSFHFRPTTYPNREMYALVQIGGRLYYVSTTREDVPWYNARLNPITHPGPFLL